jgi:hypothetical protein
MEEGQVTVMEVVIRPRSESNRKAWRLSRIPMAGNSYNPSSWTDPSMQAITFTLFIGENRIHTNTLRNARLDLVLLALI